MADFDVVVAGGRVIDPETGLDQVGDAGIRGGSIAAVSAAPLAGQVRLDAAGLVVAPGFVDLHSHAQTVPSLRMQALDGVTTALELEAGGYPLAAAYQASASEGRPINYGFAASWIGARMAVLDQAPLDGSFAGLTAAFGGAGWQRLVDGPTAAGIVAEVDKELGEGGIGIGLMPGYAPESNHEEYLALAALAGTFCRTLRRQARERRVLTLPEAIRRMTLVPAQVIEAAAPDARRKGRIQPGCDADVVAFDPDTVAEQATYDDPRRPSHGMRHVLVGGTPLVRDGRLDTTVMPGRPLRGRGR